MYGWGMGTGVGGEGAIPGTTQLLGEGSRYSGAGPGSPGTGLEWWYLELGRTGRCAAPGTTPAGPGRSMLALPVPGPLECRPWTNIARFDLISQKLSQNARVSLNISKRPVIVPISKTGVKSRLLIFWDFHLG